MANYQYPKKITIKNNLKVIFPNLALEWDYKKNKNINIKTITPGASRFKYW